MSLFYWIPRIFLQTGLEQTFVHNAHDLGYSFSPTRFEGILLQPTMWQANRSSTCVF
jgi:hypothetical protein